MKTYHHRPILLPTMYKKYDRIVSIRICAKIWCNERFPSPWGVWYMQPAWHRWHACCLTHSEFQNFVVGNTRDTHVKRVASPFQKIVRCLNFVRYDAGKVILQCRDRFYDLSYGEELKNKAEWRILCVISKAMMRKRYLTKHMRKLVFVFSDYHNQLEESKNI